MDTIFCQASPLHRAKERAKARELRKTQWWKQKIASGICYYCGQTFSVDQLTMDHKVPISRGGCSRRGNVVVSCQSCNSQKSYRTPADLVMDEPPR